MRRLLLALLISPCVAFGKPVKETTGVLFVSSPNEYRFINYGDIYRLRVSVELFHYDNPNKTTTLSGIGAGLGLKAYRSKYLDVLGTITYNAGVAISPKEEAPDCPEPDYRDYPEKKIATDDSEQARKKRQQTYDAQYEGEKARVDFDNSILKSNYQSCQSNKKNAENASQYGVDSFFDVGLQPSFRVFKHLIIGGFVGRRIERKSALGDGGDLDLEGVNYKLFVGFEW